MWTLSLSALQKSRRIDISNLARFTGSGLGGAPQWRAVYRKKVLTREVDPDEGCLIHQLQRQGFASGELGISMKV